MPKPSRWLRYCVFPLFLIALATALALLLRDWVGAEAPGQVSGPLLILAVALSAWLGGMWSGFLATALSFVVMEIFFFEPIYGFHLGWEQVPRFVCVVSVSLLISMLATWQSQAEAAYQSNKAKLRAARAIQDRLLPVAPPNCAPFELAGASIPANTVGGDYFDYIPLHGDALGIVVGDVSGHGFGPALLMAETRAYLRALAHTRETLPEIVQLLNRNLLHDTHEEQFLTLFLARLEPTTRRLTYIGAGHEAHVIKASGDVRNLPSTCFPLGLEEPLADPARTPFELETGDLVLLMTDGVYESASPSGARFGIQRVLEIVIACRTSSAERMVATLLDEVRAFAAQVPQKDDITVVIAKVSG